MRGMLRNGLIATAIALSPAAARAATTMVVCAPGYPGSTAEAQPSMDLFAAEIARQAKLASSAVALVYHEAEAAGIERLKQPDARLAMVPLPFYLQHRTALQLEAKLQVEPKGATSQETWSLVAKRGRVTSSAALAGWELISVAAYSPRFVEKIALSDFGPLPAALKYSATGAILSGLRRVAKGDDVVILLDAVQAASLSKLPFGDQLEVVHRSKPVPAHLVCTVGRGANDPTVQSLLATLPRLAQVETGRAALDALRLTQFEAIESQQLTAVQRAFDAP
jgi:hypothetical protein